MQISARQIGEILNGTVEGDPEVMVNRPSKIEEGGEGTITFLANPKYEQYAYTTSASVLLVHQDFQPSRPVGPTMVRVEDVYMAVATLLEKFGDAVKSAELGISENAFIHPEADIHSSASVGDFTSVGKFTTIGAGTTVFSQVYIGENVTIGSDCIIYPGVRIYRDCIIGDNCIIHSNSVIGADGFGFAPTKEGTYRKISQLGNVLIENDVEIGACVTIDRATMGSTVIRNGVKIDNLVQVAHNVEIGENTVIAAQAGIAGSTRIGRNCMIGGQVGFAGHLKIADGTRVQAQSGISSNIEQEGKALFGSPAIDYKEFIKSYSVFKQLPELYKKLHKMEKKLSELDNHD